MGPNATDLSSNSFKRGSAMTSQFELKVLTLLRSVDLMRDIDTEKLKKLAAIAIEVVFEPDQVIYRRGDTGQAVYLIEEGEVVIEMDVPGYGLMVMNTLEPGDFFGWSSLFPSERKMAWTRSTKFTRAIAFDAAELRAACRADHELEYGIVRRAAESTAQRIQANRKSLIDLMKEQEDKTS
jgi:CRP-like cAMP-binding protein